MNNTLDKKSLPTVSIIIPTYKDWDALRVCLSSIQKLVYPHDLIEIVVVNNDPGSSFPTDLPSGMNIKLAIEPKVGSYAARNTGIKLSCGQILAFTDSDCVVSPLWITNSVRIFLEEPKTSRVGGHIEITYAHHSPTSYELYDSIFSFKQQHNVLQRGYSVTANLIVDRKVFVEAGLFDERLLSGGDTEWGLRATVLGIPITFCEESIVYHPARSDFRSISKKSRRVTGGVFERNKNKPFALLKLLIKALLPPFNAWREINQFPAISFRQKLSVLFVICRIKLLRVLDLLLLWLRIAHQTRS